MAGEVLEVLESDPRRQAIAALEGYSYQIWQSLYRWLLLREGQALFLEGAEDIDLLGPGSAEPIQVKKADASGPVTMRSKDVLAAIVHFWQHQQSNPNFRVAFRFLTTAERGFEMSKPFGTARGLDYWDSCKFPGTDLNPLRSFFCGMEFLPQELRTFISDSSDEELRQRLIKRIEWDTGNKPQSHIAELVSGRVIAYGYEVHRLPPSDSEKVVPHLLKHVWDVVIRKENRRLVFLDFMRLFEEITSESVSKSELRRLRQLDDLRAGHGGGTTFGGGGGHSFTPEPNSILEAIFPPLNDRFVRRTALVTDLRERLNLNRVLVLAGSAGMGKSTIANTIAAADGGLWKRLSIRGLEPDAIRNRLLYATRLAEEHHDETGFIIDDLNFDKQVSLYEEALAKFIYTVLLRSGRIIITTQGSLPSRIINTHDLPAGCIIDVPVLSDEEVQELAANHGCPPGHMLKAWSRIIAINTSRHPQLVHARVRSLEAKGWPTHTDDDLGHTQDIEEIRREARSRLRDLLPSEEARLLAYRLSIIGGRFQRQNALHLGQHPPALKTAGEAFDILIGPWVERAGDKYFRLSPLLDHAAEENFTEEEVKKLHEATARAFILQGTIGPIELDGLLFHGLLGEAAEPLAAAAMSTFRVDDEHWPDLSRIIEWFGRSRLRPGEKLFPANPLISSLLRRLQFKVAAEIDGPLSLRVAAAWEQELEGWNSTDSHLGIKSAMELLFLNDLLFSLGTPLPIKALPTYLARVIALSKDPSNFFPGHEFSEAFRRNTEKIFNAHTYVGVAIGRCKDADSVVEFLTLLAELQTDESEQMWGIFKTDDYLSMMLVDQVWIDETKASPPDWPRCLERLEIIIELGVKRGAVPLVVAGYRAKATVQQEYLEDTDRALNTISEAERKLGHRHHLLEDYHAKILVMEERYAEALGVWETVLPQLKKIQTPTRTFSYRDAEICAARLGDWKKAGEFALEGAAAARQMLAGVIPRPLRTPQTELITTGFKADYAFAQWKSGDRVKSIQLFAEILNAFDDLPDPGNDTKANMLYKRVGHAIAWLNHDVRGRTDFLEPPPGCFSNQEVFDLVNDLPMQPRAGLWFLLAKIEYRLNAGDAIFRRFEQIHEQTNLSSLRAGYGDLLLGHSLRSLKTESLVSVCMKSRADLRAYATEEGVEQDQPPDSLVLTSYLFAALINLVGAGQYQSVPLKVWKRGAAEYGVLADPLDTWLDYVEKSLSADNFHLSTTLMDDAAPLEIRLVAALLLSASDDSTPEVRFYANVFLVTTKFFETWLEETEGVIGSMISGKWLVVAERERFSLLYPQINAEPIAAACRDESTEGMRKAARILLAAKNAVRTIVAENLLNILKERAK
jgi:hypothetical protein